jgi:Asp-tRNA(Asn)/Glu-tRNA(Gln) amidotransferase A subunit family amidase
MGLVGIGTDTVNSIRSPASACCLCGIRPTAGLVNGDGIVPYSLTQDTAGPLARTLEDAVRVLDFISNRRGNYFSCLNKNGLAGKRLGVLRCFFGKDENNKPVNDVMDTALAVMKKKGAVLVPVRDSIDSAWLVNEVSVHLYELKAHLNQYLSLFKARVPVRSLDEIITEGKFSPSIKDNLYHANRLDINSEEYNQRLELHDVIRKKINGILERNKLDALLYPHQQQLVCKVGGSQTGRNGVLAAVTGFPAIVVPGGFTQPDENAPLGVPVGLEILGRANDEKRIIEIAYGFEQAAKVRRKPLL